MSAAMNPVLAARAAPRESKTPTMVPAAKAVEPQQDAANSVAIPPAAQVEATPAAQPVISAAVKRKIRNERILKVVAPVFGLLLLLLVWEIVSKGGQTIPGPVATFKHGVTIFSDPFYQNGPNDQGIAYKIINSLERVALGFGLAALVGIPAGFMLGRFTFFNNMFSPIISLLRPVSPLAWLPIGLLVFKGANPAAIWTIFISSIWPMLINTAVGVQRVPADYMNVAKVLNLSEWRIFTRILFPAVLPYMMTGVRLSIGVAWLVIVAAEMLTGGVGVGFWVWDEWNNLKVESILIAIIVIGVIGLLLEAALMALAKRFSYE